MHKVFIVEDEENIRVGIQYIINHMAENWSVSGSAVNADQAVLRIKDNPAELIITDIKMPGMSGLDLMERIHMENPRILIAILSGYANFEYAQKALQNSAIDYILKPTTPDKIKQVLQKAEKIIESRKTDNRVPNAEVRQELIDLEQLLISSLIERNRERVHSIFEKIVNIDLVKHTESNYFDCIQSKLNFLMDLLFRDFKERGLGNFGESSVLEQLNNLSVVLNLAQLKEWSFNFENRIFDLIKTEKKNLTVCAIIDELKNNFSSPITLKSISDHFYLNPNYLSELFKKETGTNFNDYLTKIRINHACALLKSDKNYKIYEIAHLTGYENERYFVKVFKKAIGIAPLDFRNRINIAR